MSLISSTASRRRWCRALLVSESLIVAMTGAVSSSRMGRSVSGGGASEESSEETLLMVRIIYALNVVRFLGGLIISA